MVAPIQVGDGSQAADGSSFRVGGFGPTPTPNIQTNVAAPLGVRGAPSQAAFLAQQLQQSLESMRYPLMTAEREQGMKRAQAAGEQGAADALAGKIDEATAQADGNYRAGAVRIVAQKHALAAISDWNQYAADPKNGLANMNPQEIINATDSFFRQRLGGLENDPTAASAIAPIVTHAYSETLGRVTQAQSANRIQDALTNATSLASLQMQHGGNVFDYQQQLGTLTAAFAGDRASAKQSLDSALIQAATAQHNAGILDLLQAAPGQKELGARTQLMVSEARASITRYTTEQTAQHVQQNQFNVLSGWDTRLAAKEPIGLGEIRQRLNANDVTPEQANTYWQKSLAVTDKLDRQTDAARVLASGAPWYTAVGTQLPDGKRLTQEDFENAATDAINKLQPKDRIAAAVQVSRQHGLVYEPLRATVNNEPVNTPQGIGDVLNAYNGIRAIDQSVLPLYFNDPKRLADVHFLSNLQSSGMSPQAMADYVQKHGFDANNAGALGAKVAKLGQALDQWTSSAGKIGGISLTDYANAGQINSRVSVVAHQIAQSGLYTDADQILTQAQKQVANTSYVIKLGTGESLMVPRLATDPPVSVSQPALQWFYNGLPSYAKSVGYAGDSSELRLVPNIARPGTLQVVDVTGAPLGTDTFTLRGIAAQYTKAHVEHLRTQQSTAASDRAQQTRTIEGVLKAPALSF